MMDKNLRDRLFKQYLNWFWLRPESAVLLALRAESYASTFSLFGKGKDTVDISCGDGSYSFLAMGGELSANTDAYRSINTTMTIRKGAFDAFDYFDRSYLIEVVKTPRLHYEYGTDWKKNLLSKAKMLKFYSKLIQHDNNHTLPFDNGRMQYVFANSAYWVKNFEAHLNDLARITRPGGHIVLQMKTANIESCAAKYNFPFMGKRFEQLIDADKITMWHGLRSKKELLRTIKDIKNIKVVRFEPISGGKLDAIWNIGLRPLFNPLVKMSSRINSMQRKEIKKEWCNVLYGLFADYIMNYKCDERTATEHLIVLRKQNK